MNLTHCSLPTAVSFFRPIPIRFFCQSLSTAFSPRPTNDNNPFDKDIPFFACTTSLPSRGGSSIAGNRFPEFGCADSGVFATLPEVLPKVPITGVRQSLHACMRHSCHAIVICFSLAWELACRVALGLYLHRSQVGIYIQAIYIVNNQLQG